MTEINISEEQFNKFIKSVEETLYDVIVNDTFEFSYMCNTFSGFASRQEMAITECILNQMLKLVDDSNKDRATDLAYNMSMALDAAVAGLHPLNKKHKYSAEEVYEFCKHTFHWIAGIGHMPSMFESLFNVVCADTDEEDPSDND